MGTPTEGEARGNLAERPRSERGVAFLFGTATSTAGLAIGTLDATGITTTAGNLSRGAIYTSAYLAILLFTRAFTVPHTARLSARLGIENAYRFTVGLGVVSWAIASILILAGVPGLPVLLCFAPLFGISGGFAAVLGPIFSKAYIAGKDMAGAYAWMSVIAGVAWATGSAAGGFILNSVEPGWGLLSKAILGIPMFVIVTRIAPATDPRTPKAHKRVWYEMKKQLTENKQLRRAAILGCGVSMFAAPMVSMIVPIADALRQTPLLPGAGILMASMALGQLSSPYLVSRLSRDRASKSTLVVMQPCRRYQPSFLLQAGNHALNHCAKPMWTGPSELAQLPIPVLTKAVQGMQ
jgi:MFS family permease